MRRILLMVLSQLLLSSCSHSSSNDAAPASNTPSAEINIQTYVYECPGDFSFVARLENDKAWLFLPGKTIDLPQVRSDSGATYSNGSDTFWSKGDNATIETSEINQIACKNNRGRAIWEHAKLNGVDFRATGNEPGWYMEISNREDIRLVTDYGQRTYRFTSATIKTKPHDTTSIYHARNDEDIVEIVIKGMPCHDNMSGEEFPATVSILVNNKRYTGCGRALH